MPGQRLRDYHISLRQFRLHYRIYVVLFLLVLPFVIGAAQFPTFYFTYPFYKAANRSNFDFWAWEGLYALQFVSLEFFFRGFILHGLRRRFGAGAIFVMVVPYCMIHYGKPMAETFGAIVRRARPGHARHAHALDLGRRRHPHRRRADHGPPRGEPVPARRQRPALPLPRRAPGVSR